MAEARVELIAEYLEDPSVEEIIVLGGRRTFVVREGEKVLLPNVVDAPSVRRLADQLLAETGRRLDLASPIVSAQMKDGSRVHMVGPPVTRPEELNIQIRRFVVRARSLADLVERGTVTPDQAAVLAEAVRSDASILVAGSPGAGKTTLVNALLAETPPDRRVVTCEEVFEIDVDLPDMTQMQTRDAGLGGGAAITLRDLVRSSLRQRPDRLVVGEVRGPEALDLLLALNAGCSGLATIHANSAVDGLRKAVSYCVLAGENIRVDFVRSSLAAVVDLVVFMRRHIDGRRVDHLVAVSDELSDGRFVCEPVAV